MAAGKTPLTLRIGDRGRERLDTLAKATGTTRADVVRAALNVAFRHEHELKISLEEEAAR